MKKVNGVKQKTNLFIISGPSGAGEDSVIKGLSQHFDTEIVTTTSTRDLRPGESNGHPYYFISKEEFRAGIEDGKFVEWAEHYNGNFYGVTRDEIERAQKSDAVVLWKIDYKGVVQAKKLFPDVVAIFLSAPLESLEKRIRSRSEVSEEYVTERMDYTKEWLNHTDIYDYTVQNLDGKLDVAIMKTVDIIKEHRA